MKNNQLYQKYSKGRHWEKHPTIYAKRFARFLGEKNFEGLLVDAGCGSGRDVNVFYNEGLSVLGIDYSEEVIEKARVSYLNCKFEKQNVERLGLGNNSVSAYFMINVVHYVDKEKTLTEICRTLKNGGYFFVHFNTEIIDGSGSVDYQHDEIDINRLVSDFEVLERTNLVRIDETPKRHTHKILELILQK